MNAFRWLVGILGIIGAWRGCALYFTLRERHALKGYQRAHEPAPRDLRSTVRRVAETHALDSNRDRREETRMGVTGISSESGHGYDMKRLNGKRIV